MCIVQSVSDCECVHASSVCDCGVSARAVPCVRGVQCGVFTRKFSFSPETAPPAPTWARAVTTPTSRSRFLPSPALQRTQRPRLRAPGRGAAVLRDAPARLIPLPRRCPNWRRGLTAAPIAPVRPKEPPETATLRGPSVTEQSVGAPLAEPTASRSEPRGSVSNTGQAARAFVRGAAADCYLRVERRWSTPAGSAVWRDEDRFWGGGLACGTPAGDAVGAGPDSNATLTRAATSCTRTTITSRQPQAPPMARVNTIRNAALLRALAKSVRLRATSSRYGPHARVSGALQRPSSAR
jgi:hypothetical protein